MTIDNGINKIHYGEIHFYYPLKFDTDLEFDDICDRISNSNYILNENRTDEIYNTLAKQNEELVEKLKEDPTLKNAKVTALNPSESSETSSVTLMPDDIVIEIESLDNSFKINFISKEIDFHNMLYERSNDEFDKSAEIYGQAFTDSQSRFLLLPFEVTLCNDISVWVTARLYVFTNKYAILKLELPLLEVPTKPLRSEQIDDYILDINNRWSLPFFDDFDEPANEGEEIEPFISISRIYGTYLLNIMQDESLYLLPYSHKLRNILLVDYEGMPTSIEQIPDRTGFDLFSFINAPVPQYQYKYLKEKANGFLKNNTWNGGNVKYLLKTTGGCLTTIDKNTLKQIAKDCDFNLKDKSLDASERIYFYSNICDTIRVSTEFALSMVLLKKSISTSTYIDRHLKAQDLFNAREKYNLDLIEFCTLQESCFGSVSEQVEAFERGMPYYFKEEITEMKLKAANDNLEIQKQIQNEEMQRQNEKMHNTLSISGFLFTVFFGLPAVHETISILREFLQFAVPNNIAILTINNVSVIVWTISAFFICRKLISNNPKAFGFLKRPFAFIKTKLNKA